jgi:PAS domain S-box-containing protein
MYVPVYRRGMPTDSTAQRRAAIDGWVYSPYRMDDLMQGVLGTREQTGDQHVHLSIFDGAQPSPQNLLHTSAPAGNEIPASGVRFSRQMTMDFNGQPWTVCCTQAAAGAFTAAYAQVWFATVASTLVAVLLFSLVRVLENTGVVAQRRAEELTGGLRESEKRNRTILQTALDGFFQADTQGRLLAVNDSYCRMSGYSEAELLGMHVSDLAVTATVSGVAARIAKVMAQGEDRFEFRQRRKDGTVYDVEVSGQFQPDAGGGLLVAFLHDITQRKRTENELARLSVIQAELMRLATKFVNVPVERQDTAIQQSLASLGRLIRADRAYLCTYDFAKGVMSTTHEWCAQGVRGTIGDMQSVPIARLADWVALHQRGEAVHIPSAATLPAGSPLRQLLERQGIRSLITLPLLLEGACLGFVGFDAVQEERVWPEADVSLLRILARLYAHFEARRAAERETLELQERLAQARDAAEKASQAKGLFLANMSHEIRTPLNAILGYAQLMERDCRSCPQEPRLHAITRSGEHLLELITSLLELVRSDTRAITLTPSEFDFPQVLEDVRLMFAPQMANQDLTLAVSCTPEVPRFIHADQGRIRQVLANLVGNALKFTEKGSVCLAASVQAGGTPEAVTLAVEVNDTGCGIRADERERIFDVFYVAESGRKAGKGTGLGLPLSRRYARGLGGDVTVTSRLGDGSSFRFTFSALIASAAGAKQRQDRTVLRLAPGQPACRILVVDDDFTNRDVLVAMLEPVGFTVEAAASALEALERLRQSPPVGLVLLDKLMPGMDGYTAIGHIRGLPGGSDIRIVVVTAVGFAAERALALAAGADGYIAKPVRRQTLMAEIARVTDLRYDYDDEGPGVIPAVSAPAILSPEALARLPVAQRQALEEALRRGDIQQLRDLVGTVAHTDAGLAAGIRPLVAAYDYDRLQHLLQAAKGEAL